MIETEIDLTELLRGTSLPPGDVSEFVTAALVLDCRNQLGEGILFDDRKHTVMWPDIMSCKFHTLLLNYKEPTKVVHTVYDLPKKLCSVGMLEEAAAAAAAATAAAESGLPVLCAWEDGFQLYDIAKQAPLSEMSSGEDVNPSKGPTRLNDGRVEPGGRRYICGGFYGDTPGTVMKVYKVDQDAATGRLFHAPIVDNIEVANSICWSLDGKTMYLADSPTKQIHAYDYCSETGAVTNKKLLHSKPATEIGVPDGSCVDADGFLWNAVWRAGAATSCVQRIDPATGLVVFTVHMPDKTSQVTCCCFGGENLDFLFITTAAISRDPAKEPHAGGLYAVRLPFQGRKESRLKFTVPSAAPIR